MSRPMQDRRRWAIATAIVVAGFAWLSSRAGGLLRPATGVYTACGLLCAAMIAGILAPPRILPHITAAVASARLTVVVLAIAAWQGDAREAFGALAVWVAFDDTAARRNAGIPLLPTAVATAASLAWTAEHRDALAARPVLVCIVCAAAATIAARLHRRTAS